MLTRLLTVFIALQFVWATQVLAAPAMPDIIEAGQSDGTKLKVRIHGDEFQNWMESADTGHTIIRNKASGNWEYAEHDLDGKLKSTSIKVVPGGANAPAFIQPGIKPPRDTDSEKKHQDGIKQRFQQRLMPAPAYSPSSSLDQGSVTSNGPIISESAAWVATPVTGQRKLLLIMVSFNNRSLVTTPQQWYDVVFNTTSGVKSVANYYDDNSFGSLNIVPVSHSQGGPAGVVTVNLNLVHEYNGTLEATWAAAAINQAAAHVNFSALDTNGNGILEPSEALVYFIVAGYEQSGSSKAPSVWAHAVNYPSGGVYAGGVTFPVWARNGELNDAGARHPIGVITHELGHQLAGLPDLYDTSSYNAGLGVFSLMASGSWGAQDNSEHAGTTPVGLDAWSREYTGWTMPVVPTSTGSVSLAGSLVSANNALKLINPSISSAEYFLVENRRPQGWDLGMSNYLGTGWAGGLLTLHVDNTMGTNRYGATAHQGVVAELANLTAMGCNMLIDKNCYGKQQTFFYSSNNSSFNNSTTPASKYYNGTPSFRALDNISAPGATMTATFSIGGTAPVGYIKINSGAIYTPSTSVTLNMTATVAAPSTVKDMCFSNDGNTWSTWEAYKTTRAWTLDAGSDGDRTVMVKYRDAGGNESIPYGATITLDTTRPTAVIVINSGLGGPTKASVIGFSASGAGVSSYKYKVDGGSWSAEIPAATAVNYSGLAVGNHTLSMIGKDAAGNWQLISDASTLNWTIEQTPATTTATPSGGNYTAPQSVSLSADETATIYYTTNGAAPTTASSKYSGPLAITATTTLKYFSVDVAGNVEAIKTQLYNLPPTTTVIGVPASTKLTTATLTVGGVGVVAYKYTLDSGAQSAEFAVATKIALTGLSVANHTVSVIGKNSAGQWQSAPTEISWTVEQTPATVSASPAAGSYSSSQTVTLSANETATIYYTVTGAAPTTTSPKYTTPLTVTIPTTLKYFAVDSAGNVSAVKTELYLPPPVSTITGTPSSLSKLTTATLTVGGVGITHYKFKLDSGAYSAVEIPITTKIALTGLSVANHTVSVIGKNSVGDWQSTATTASWTIEQTAPVTTASPVGGTYATPQTVTLSASETATIYYTTNGAAPTTTSAKYTAPISISTTTTLKYLAVDQAGNAEAVKTQVYALAPTATISGVPDTVAAGTPIVFSAGGGYVVSYKFRLNGAPWSIESPVTTARTLAGLPAGTHLIEVIGKNVAGTWQQDVDATAKVLNVN